MFHILYKGFHHTYNDEKVKGYSQAGISATTKVVSNSDWFPSCFMLYLRRFHLYDDGQQYSKRKAERAFLKPSDETECLVWNSYPGSSFETLGWDDLSYICKLRYAAIQMLVGKPLRSLTCKPFAENKIGTLYQYLKYTENKIKIHQQNTHIRDTKCSFHSLLLTAFNSWFPIPY